MAKPKSAGLTPSQLEKMKTLLLERRSELITGTKNWDNDSDVGSGSGDEGDLASAAVAADLTFQTRARETEILKQIDEALSKIDGGNYGRCVDCGTGIAMPRLEILPFAELCIDCQEKADELGNAAERASMRDRFELS